VPIIVLVTNAIQEDVVAKENFTQYGAKNDRNHLLKAYQKMMELVQIPKLIHLDLPQTTPISRL
jgi:hypothetical protein